MQTPVAQVVRNASSIHIFLSEIWPFDREPTVLELDSVLYLKSRMIARRVEKPTYYARLNPFGALPTIAIVD